MHIELCGFAINHEIIDRMACTARPKFRETETNKPCPWNGNCGTADTPCELALVKPFLTPVLSQADADYLRHLYNKQILKAKNG